MTPSGSSSGAERHAAGHPERNAGDHPDREVTASGALNPAEGSEPWPRGISHRATMRISDVLAALRAEFPAVTHSKLRFLEEQGLVDPVRTSAGYRQYSPADVERLRFVLIEQRDRYLPLKVIKGKLAALDEGTADVDQPLVPHVIAQDGESTSVTSHRTMEALAIDAGVDVAVVVELVESGVLRPDAQGHLDAWDREVVVVAAQLADHGIEARHLRTLRSAAERSVDLVMQAVTHLRGGRESSDQARLVSTATELGELCAQLQTAWVRQGIADL